jgi:hypothetical protein
MSSLERTPVGESSAESESQIYHSLGTVALGDLHQLVQDEGLLAIEPAHQKYTELPTQEAFDWQAIIDQAKATRKLENEPFYSFFTH